MRSASRQRSAGHRTRWIGLRRLHERSLPPQPPRPRTHVTPPPPSEVGRATAAPRQVPPPKLPPSLNHVSPPPALTTSPHPKTSPPPPPALPPPPHPKTPPPPPHTHKERARACARADKQWRVAQRRLHKHKSAYHPLHTTPSTAPSNIPHPLTCQPILHTSPSYIPYPS